MKEKRKRKRATRLTNLHSVESSLDGVESSLLVVSDVSSDILDGEGSGDDGGSSDGDRRSRDSLDSPRIPTLVGSTC